MLTTDLLIGVAGAITGIGVLAMHCAAPQKLGKLLAFQNQYGKTAGKIIHIIFYGIIPLTAGTFFLYKAFMH